jgi:hypothetical protein
VKASDLQDPVEVCASVGVAPVPVNMHDRVGLSRSARVERPVHGLRLWPSPGVSGWYIWSGEMSEAQDFFEPTHASHLSDSCPLVLPFLNLPPGWRFLTDGEYVDVWFDASLIQGS